MKKRWAVLGLIGVAALSNALGDEPASTGVSTPTATAVVTSAAPTMSTPAATLAPSPTADSPTPAPTSPTPSAAAATPAPALHPVAGIIDGDTIAVRIDGERVRVRIIGIDTPERGECGYQEAASALQSLAQSSEVRLEADPAQDDADRHGRLLRHVYTTDGISVAEELIALGLGRELTYDGPYANRETHLAAEAKAAGDALGIWGASCALTTQPAPPAPPASPSAQECLIKGNINREGVRIYHLPGQQHYDDTVIDKGYGERWFCTEAEAEAAGWRKSRR